MQDLVQYSSSIQPADMDAYRSILNELSENNVARRKRKTDPRKIKLRQGKGDKSFKYIKGIEAYRWLDKNYPGWSAEVLPESYRELAGWINIAVRLTVIEPITLHKRVITRTGSKEAIVTRETNSIASVQYIKAAETDAIKRCCVALGAWNDVYSDDDLDDSVSIEDRRWYIEMALPKILQNPAFVASPEKLFQQMLAFDSGLLTKEKIMSILKD